MNVTIWVDPICPWCWMTARWMAEVVQPARDLNITWKTISLKEKNQPGPDSPFHDRVAHTHKLLRVFSAIDAAEGNEAAFRFYWQAGTHIHHDEDLFVDAATLLAEADLDPSYADAYDDPQWDAGIKQQMEDGLALVGNDVGTPIIGLEVDGDKDIGDKDTGGTQQVGVFGPVISRLVTGDEGLAVWDAVVTLATTDGFWELKRTRTVEPDFGT